MKIKDYIFLAFKNISRRKKGVVSNIVLISISVIICVLAISFNLSLSDFLNRALVNNISYRSIVVLGVEEDKQNEVINKLENIEHILKVVTEKEERIMTTMYTDYFDEYKKDMSFSFKGSDINTQPSVIKGRNIEPGQTNVCLIPNKIYYKQYSSDGKLRYDKEAYINGEELIGKKIKMNYSSYDESSGERIANKTFTEEFEVIGIYDIDEYVLEENWFVSFEDVSRINKTVEENTILNPNVIYSTGGSSQITVFVDNSLNLDSTLEKVEELGYRCIVRSTANTYIVVIINVVTVIVISILMLIVLFSITTSSIKAINDRKYEIGMLKAIGYKNKNIKIMLLFENLVIGIGAYLIGLVISIISMYSLKIFVFSKNIDFDKLDVNLNIWVCLIALIFSIIVPTIASYLGGKGIFNKTPLSLNKVG